jgi:hypothetical protein
MIYIFLLFIPLVAHPLLCILFGLHKTKGRRHLHAMLLHSAVYLPLALGLAYLILAQKLVLLSEVWHYGLCAGLGAILFAKQYYQKHLADGIFLIGRSRTRILMLTLAIMLPGQPIVWFGSDTQYASLVFGLLVLTLIGIAAFFLAALAIIFRLEKQLGSPITEQYLERR